MLMLGTLGFTWGIVPELLGFTNRKDIKIFSNRKDLENLSSKLSVIDEIWLATTNDDGAADAVKKIRDWQLQLDAKVPIIRFWSLSGIKDLKNQNEVDKMRELIWRLALKATDRYGFQNVCYCLAGGRKTMSSDLQQAASIFGGYQLLHLIASGFLESSEVSCFLSPLSEKDALYFDPVIISSELERAEYLDLQKDISPEKYYIEMAEELGDISLPVELEPILIKDIENLKKQGRNMLFNYARELTEKSTGTPFQALYALPPKIINSLKEEKIGSDKKNKNKDMQWLKKMPKTDLHCHLGGVADAKGLIEIAEAMKQDLDKYQNEKLYAFLDSCLNYIAKGSIGALKEYFYKPNERLKDSYKRLGQEFRFDVPIWSFCGSFILLFKENPELLNEFIFGESYDSEKHVLTGIGIDKYESLGDLQGSSLLQKESSIRAVCKLLIKKCIDENIKYIEIRCSPVNYTRDGLEAKKVVQFIQEEMKKAEPELYSSLILIGSRHGFASDCCRHVELAEELIEENKDCKKKQTVPLVGFDLAGNEKFDAETFAPFLKPLFKKCFHITVHAGETQEADSIWKAVYSLNAERIGHGLKLIENKALMEYFLDRSISIEMCPSSNMQIIGYKDSFLPFTDNFDKYPLKEYLEAGLKVTVNTDNMGISRTNATNELYQAARMTPSGLSKWDILQIIKNGFSSSFASHEKRRELILNAEKEVLDILNKIEVN